jgi:hypothetical protein
VQSVQGGAATMANMARVANESLYVYESKGHRGFESDPHWAAQAGRPIMLHDEVLAEIVQCGEPMVQ